ncbi:hypothetical protein [Nonomuraea sp. B5E05]|uniref:hypothetical protein n=1 Tax=Nonomuraea sp. B5E05 TaxID=3153569 RepID=UPI0032600333
MGSPLVTLGLLLLLVATMITIGTALTGQGLTAMLRRPRALVAAMAVNVVVVPAAAVAVVHGLALDGPIAYGIVLAAAAALVSLIVPAYGLVMYAVSGLALTPLRRTARLGKDFAR